MAETPPSFVKWREEFVSQEKGSRLVHFYLEDSNGDSHLAVIGTERSLRHMLYVASEDFCLTRFGFCDKSRTSSLKWRSRREAVDWLSSLLPMKNVPQRVGLNGFVEAQNGSPRAITDNRRSDIVWSGASWVCGKQLCHYPAFSRNKSIISAHSFALIMSEEENRYLAYIEDMYEDKKGQKKVKVRWFHQNREFDVPIPPPAPHHREVFITHYTQVISAECVDDVATVLTPEDYSRAHPSASALLCFRQYSKNKFRYFDLRSLKGYFTQPALLSSLSDPPSSGPRTNMYRRLYASKSVQDSMKAVSVLGPRNQVKPPYAEGQKVEVLCQDSGIRGCWFRCTVLELCHKQIRVQYDDLQCADDSENLEEWVRAYRAADVDKLGMRAQQRLTIRPAPEVSASDDIRFVAGSAIDVWRDDGWWEGIVLSEENNSSLRVYFPGEGIFYECEKKDARVSRDWVRCQWVEIEPKPECLTLIPSSSPKTASVGPTKRAESGSSAMSDQMKDDTQKNGRKRARDETIEE